MIPIYDMIRRVARRNGVSIRTRPSSRELSKKLKAAMKAVSARAVFFANPAKVVSELDGLGIADSGEVWTLIGELLLEISAADYSGGRPPAKAYESAIVGQELFAFSWQSQKLGKKMYLKFVLRGGSFFYVSLHHDRPRKINDGDER